MHERANPAISARCQQRVSVVSLAGGACVCALLQRDWNGGGCAPVNALGPVCACHVVLRAGAPLVAPVASPACFSFPLMPCACLLHIPFLPEVASTKASDLT